MDLRVRGLGFLKDLLVLKVKGLQDKGCPVSALLASGILQLRLPSGWDHSVALRDHSRSEVGSLGPQGLQLLV